LGGSCTPGGKVILVPAGAADIAPAASTDWACTTDPKLKQINTIANTRTRGEEKTINGEAPSKVNINNKKRGGYLLQFAWDYRIGLMIA
jgi:hypothetical protein